ncbi:MAG: glycosyl transferase family 2 [Rickettsiaceae bacterium]|jgi:glycosyltransferase involved in cell wall biosynthesis|nr:glycosyl transferase family 2 [Rickettsiaceae bacterium]
MTRLPISAFIIAQDEADRITKPILSIRDWVDELIVIDSGSKDNTVEVAESLGATTVFNQWRGYGPQKVFGETLCKNKWLLNIDADEEVTPELRDEIIKLFDNGLPSLEAYLLNTKVISRFDDKPRRFAPGHDFIRLYNKDYAGYKDSTVHDTCILKPGVNAKVGKLKYTLTHRTFRSYRHAVEKINRYSSMQAEDMVKRGRRPSSARIIAEPFFAFFKAYFIRKYCFLGVYGFIEAIIYVFARTIRLAKARELWIEKDLQKDK